MSKTQYAECSRSVSDGDLASVEKKKAKEFAFAENTDKQVFFTLPRWMSVRRKKNKIKYVKVDVPFNSHDGKEKNKCNSLESKSSQKDKHSDKPNFIRKLFRSNSFFSSSSSKNHNKTLSKVPTSPSLFSSNSDVRSSSAFNFHSFDFQEYFKDKIPAVCGLKNHGNTCFMNAVIQCLSNTDMFAEYFVMNHFKMDLLRRNKSHSKRYGTRGEVTEQLGALLKSLWSCQYYANISNKFKHSVAKYGSQYEGNDQHDAQEFLLWLLDKVHEDLNTAPKEKYKKTKGNLGRSDEDIAAEMLANHLRCNSSFIHDLFQGQFRSSLCCLGCGRFSNTFDPYLCISLPIPSSHTIPVFLHIVFLEEKVKMKKVGVLLDAQANVYDLREKLNMSFKTSKDNLLILEIIDGEFQRTFCGSDIVSDFKDSKNLFAIEVPSKNNVSMETEKISLVISSKIEFENGCEMLWRPFVLDVTREVSYTELQKEIFDAMSYPFKNIFDLDLKNCFSLCINDGEPINEKICSSVDMPLYMPAIDKALMLCLEGIPHVKLSIVWNKVAKEIFPTELNFIELHSSIENVVNSRKQSDEMTLQECFDLYFNEERLEREDAWVCAYCHHRLPCVKSLSLWTIPDVFIVHLKRFRQSSTQRVKIMTYVNFPLTGLDMNPYVAARNQNVQQIHNTSLTSLTFWSPWKRPRYRPYTRFEDNVYELYAVCNHHGSMQGGHYTAYCRNPVNGHWYNYDDTKVQEIPVSEVISTDAYILFYQRSNLTSHSCASSSSSGYSSASSTYSVGPEHWAFHMASFFRDIPLTSKSQDSLYDVGKTASLDRRTTPLHRPFDRSMKAYSTLCPPAVDRVNTTKLDLTDSNISYKELKSEPKVEIPPPPPPAKHYWTVTSV